MEFLEFVESEINKNFSERVALILLLIKGA